MHLWSYLLRRILQIPILLFCVVLVSFLLIHLAPGDPIVYLISQQATDPTYIARERAIMGLDKPITTQFVIYFSRLLSGDFGYSLTRSAPALSIVLERVPRTLILMAISLGISITSGILIGVEAARRPHRLLDYLTTSISLAGASIPVFWTAILLVLVFAVTFRLFPVSGMYTLGTNPTGIDGALDILRHAILPATALAIANIAGIARLTRQTTIDALGENYVLTARMKGISERTIAYRHALRNALGPVVAAIGLSFGFFVSWSVLVEIVFSWPGLGQLLWFSVQSHDFPTLMALFIIMSFMTILGNLSADIINLRLNPRTATK